MKKETVDTIWGCVGISIIFVLVCFGFSMSNDYGRFNGRVKDNKKCIEELGIKIDFFINYAEKLDKKFDLFIEEEFIPHAHARHENDKVIYK